jgi:hypothetical protein
MPKGFCKEQVKSAENEINAEYQKYEDIFANLNHDDPEIEEKIKEVNSIIQLVNNRIFYTEDRLSKIVAFSLALMAIGMAFFAAIINLTGLTFIVGLITALFFILTGGIAALVNTFYVNPRYPFRAMKNDWKWFYSGIIDKKYRPKLIFQDSPSELFSKKLLHMRGLNDYAEKILVEDKVERLKVDLQQLYLLHVNEKYKNRYLSNLRNILILGLIITSVFLFILVGLIANDKVTQSEDKADTNNVVHEVRPIEKPMAGSRGQ